MYSLPIPGDDDEVPIRYRDLNHGNINIGQVVEDLTRGRHGAWDLAGLDPDVRPDAIPRHNDWRGLFGQTWTSQPTWQINAWGREMYSCSSASSGRCRKLVPVGALSGAPPELQILWGWLQIEQVCRVDEIRHEEKFDWATYHCHFSWSGDPRNTLYVATHGLDLNETVTTPGAGVFPQFDERLVLTRPGGTASQWRLPRWFYPDGGKTPLTHFPRELWRRDGGFAYAQRRGPGQEFVLDLEQYPEAMGWLSGLVLDVGATDTGGQ